MYTLTLTICLRWPVASLCRFIVIHEFKTNFVQHFVLRLAISRNLTPLTERRETFSSKNCQDSSRIWLKIAQNNSIYLCTHRLRKQKIESRWKMATTKISTEIDPLLPSSVCPVLCTGRSNRVEQFSIKFWKSIGDSSRRGDIVRPCQRVFSLCTFPFLRLHFSCFSILSFSIFLFLTFYECSSFVVNIVIVWTTGDKDTNMSMLLTDVRGNYRRQMLKTFSYYWCWKGDQNLFWIQYII